MFSRHTSSFCKGWATVHNYGGRHFIYSDLLLVFMRLGLWNWLGKTLLEVLAFQRVLSVVGDQVVQAVKRHVVDQEIASLAADLPGTNMTVVDTALTPAGVQSHNNVRKNNIL